MGYQKPDEALNRNSYIVEDFAYVPPLNQAELWNTSLYDNLCYSAKTVPSLDSVLEIISLLRLGKQQNRKSKASLNSDHQIQFNLDRESIYAPLDPSIFSSGERQRILLGRAILSGRSILISDEGTSALDKQMEEQVFAILKQTFHGGMVLVTHDWHVLKNCDRALVLNRGIIEESGDPNVMIKDKASIVHLLFGKSSGVA